MEKSFEKSLDELEGIVSRLESGDLPLEESLELFEKGIKLSRECRQRLAGAERRIEILTQDANGNFSAEAFEPETSGAATSTNKTSTGADDADAPV